MPPRPDPSAIAAKCDKLSKALKALLEDRSDDVAYIAATDALRELSAIVNRILDPTA
jgi:hypothetical protein